MISIGGAICNRVRVSSVACVVCELQRIKNNNTSVDAGASLGASLR